MTVQSRLAHWLAGTYSLLIVYASLQPFSGWTASDQTFFLFSGAGRYTTFDFVVNVAAYLPLGFFACLMRSRRAFAFALALGATLSFLMESTQMLLPSRAASSADLLANVLGTALGALAGAGLKSRPHWARRISNWHRGIFLSGRNADAGLALLAIWLLLQLNPAIPIFGATYQPAGGVPVDSAGAIIEAAQTGCHVLGVGLFLATLLRHRAHLGAAVLLLVGAGLLLKAGAALLLIKPAAWEYWLRPGVGIGAAIGASLLLVLVWSGRRTQTLLGAIALLSGLLLTLLAPESVVAQAPLAIFNWSYGHLLNFNGLTHAGLQLWPLLAAMQLALAGTAPGRKIDPV